LKRASANAPCPCGSGKKYKGCCKRWHDGEPAPTPEALMRSRYTAYAIADVSYLIRTTHPDGPHWRPDTAAWKAELAGYCEQVEFRGLRVEHAEAAGDEGRVRFHATLAHGGRDLSFGEDSRFLRVGGRWLYHSGDRV
jgi:SEC-C motif-containing protein